MNSLANTPSTTPAWKFHFSPEETWEAMLSDMEGAEHSIDFEQYTVEDTGPGQIGRRFLDMFIRKSRQGVAVRVLIDGFGSWQLLAWPGVIEELSAAGVSVTIHTASTHDFSRFFRIFFRDHRKLSVVDGRRAIIGGVIVSETERPWRDSAVSVNGEMAMLLQHFYNEAWQCLSSNGPLVVSPPERVGDFSVIGSGPHRKQRFFLEELIRRVNSASLYIHITSPYCNPPRQLTAALRRAGKRGVEIILLLPGQSDNFVASVVSYSFFGIYLHLGAKIFLYPANVHAKSITIDDEWSTIGSSNMDRLSLLHNYELNIASTDTKFTAEIENRFQEDCKISQQIDQDDLRARPLVHKILSIISAPFRPII